MNTVVLLTTIYKRPELTRVVLEHFASLKVAVQDRVALQLLCVGSEGKVSEAIAREAGFEYMEFPNSPLSEKHNAGMQVAASFNPEGVIYMGSDNFITEDMFSWLLGALDLKIDFRAFKDIYFLRKGDWSYWQGYPENDDRFGSPVGPGRYYSRHLLQQLDWRPWGDEKRDRFLDALVRNNLKELSFISEIRSVREFQGYLLDVKTSANITKLTNFDLSCMGGEDYVAARFPQYKMLHPFLLYPEKAPTKVKRFGSALRQAARLKRRLGGMWFRFRQIKRA